MTSIAIKPSIANQVRARKNVDPALTADDIVKLTGFDRTQVKNALTRLPKVRLKSMAPRSNRERSVG